MDGPPGTAIEDLAVNYWKARFALNDTFALPVSLALELCEDAQEIKPALLTLEDLTEACYEHSPRPFAVNDGGELFTVVNPNPERTRVQTGQAKNKETASVVVRLLNGNHALAHIADIVQVWNLRRLSSSRERFREATSNLLLVHTARTCAYKPTLPLPPRPSAPMLIPPMAARRPCAEALATMEAEESGAIAPRVAGAATAISTTDPSQNMANDMLRGLATSTATTPVSVEQLPTFSGLDMQHLIARDAVREVPGDFGEQCFELVPAGVDVFLTTDVEDATVDLLVDRPGPATSSTLDMFYELLRAGFRPDSSANLPPLTSGAAPVVATTGLLRSNCYFEVLAVTEDVLSKGVDQIIHNGRHWYYRCLLEMKDLTVIPTFGRSCCSPRC